MYLKAILFYRCRLRQNRHCPVYVMSFKIKECSDVAEIAVNRVDRRIHRYRKLRKFYRTTNDIFDNNKVMPLCNYEMELNLHFFFTI